MHATHRPALRQEPDVPQNPGRGHICQRPAISPAYARPSKAVAAATSTKTRRRPYPGATPATGAGRRAAGDQRTCRRAVRRARRPSARYAPWSEAGLDRDDVYLTNAVKHFKWTPAAATNPRPRSRTISERLPAVPGLSRDRARRRPRYRLPGATAVHSLARPLGARPRQPRQLIESDYGPCLVTVHPSSILRPRRRRARAAYDAFVADLSAPSILAQAARAREASLIRAVYCHPCPGLSNRCQNNL